MEYRRDRLREIFSRRVRFLRRVPRLRVREPAAILAPAIRHRQYEDRSGKRRRWKRA